MWQYIVAFLRKESREIPRFLQPIAVLTPEAELEIAQFRRKAEEARWSDKLESFVAGRQYAPAAVTPVANAPWDLRLRLGQKGAIVEGKRSENSEYVALAKNIIRDLAHAMHESPTAVVNPDSLILLELLAQQYRSHSSFGAYSYLAGNDILHRLISDEKSRSKLITEEGLPFVLSPHSLRWNLRELDQDYEISLVSEGGEILDPLFLHTAGPQPYYFSRTTIYGGPAFESKLFDPLIPVRFPRAAFDTLAGVELFKCLDVALPPSLSAKVREVPLKLCLRCELALSSTGSECLLVTVSAEGENCLWQPTFFGWEQLGRKKGPGADKNNDALVYYDKSALLRSESILREMGLQKYDQDTWKLPLRKNFAEVFYNWCKRIPANVKLSVDAQLQSLLDGDLTASLQISVDSVDIDWFDVSVSLDIADTNLTTNEISLLLAARGQFVRLPDKGWRRLSVTFSAEDEQRLAQAGLSVDNFSGKKQRMHALQLNTRVGEELMTQAAFEAVRKRATEIVTRVEPKLPKGIQATLRPYQVEGFNFLAYLATNNFGGILADDMGLGKTLQSLTWFLWLREQKRFPEMQLLVVCPKSVGENWKAEAQRFAPGLAVEVLSGSPSQKVLDDMQGADVVVVNYTKLRLMSEQLKSRKWLAVILDEGQFIKNPDSQTTQATLALQAHHRLVLTGTPIENRVLDLWSLMNFAMPGMLGMKQDFKKVSAGLGEIVSHKWVAARAKPFLLRRTKQQVLTDLPEKIEEEVLCTIEGKQESLYQAELKFARQALLKIKTKAQLSKVRFQFFSSLLKLRQICCHPGLVTEQLLGESSVKLDVLLELIEPILQGGNKVLVFSQFTSMLAIIRERLIKLKWKYYYLDGSTEDRGALVDKFQRDPDPSAFLLSLRAGGFGLNLTSASYVVLCDPWWNPAVESQAIDRTHRIGQKQNVIAYRLIVKNSIEEKIKLLQKKKSSTAKAILEDEAACGALSLDDFRFLFDLDGEVGEANTDDSEPLSVAGGEE